MITDEMVAINCQCYKLRKAARKVTRVYDDALRPAGIKANQCTTLIAVSLMGPVSITNIADKLGMERTTVTRNLVPLETAGFIKLQPGHGRTRNVLITPKGKAIIKKAKPAWADAQKQVLETISESELANFNNILGRFA
ncbi:MAG: MarR family winged helix-turn-helix transcriptional regulator [Proteobacteria bacterium]|nr:MarR family winged helix-turn-helix transcriptional regulator [Pseudomonadota bacterium]